VVDAGEPAILLGSDTGPNPAECLQHALAACLTTSVVTSRPPAASPDGGRVEPRRRHGRAGSARPLRRLPERLLADPGLVPRRRGRARREAARSGCLQAPTPGELGPRRHVRPRRARRLEPARPRRRVVDAVRERAPRGHPAAPAVLQARDPCLRDHAPPYAPPRRRRRSAPNARARCSPRRVAPFLREASCGGERDRFSPGARVTLTSSWAAQPPLAYLHPAKMMFRASAAVAWQRIVRRPVGFLVP
jgi:hypothetical protein